jgi:hypothetical protein
VLPDPLGVLVFLAVAAVIKVLARSGRLGAPPGWTR